MTQETCPRCGAAAEPGARRCAFCGAALAEADTSQPVVDAVNPELGATMPRVSTAPPAPATTGPAATQPPTARYPAPSAVPYPAQPLAGVYGYPATFPMGAPAGHPGMVYPSTYGYGYGYGAYGYYPAALPAPRRAPGETYALVVAWIATVLAGICAAAGLIGGVISLILFFGGNGDDLSFLGISIGYSLGPIVAGGFGLWYGIFGILRRPSPRFQLPNAWLMLGLVALALGGALALWNINEALDRAPGVAFGVFPLAFLTGALPALTILAFASQRMKNPSTRRHVWLSMFYGMTLAALLAQILEAILTFVIIFALGLAATDATAVLSPENTTSPKVLLAGFLVLSVVAPLVEEGVKPLGALLLIRRLRTPADAFLVGVAGGIGFDIFETITYIGSGQADWVAVAIERIGAGLLHGLGAGMGALFWYYLINGKGVPLRWLRAVGAILYAVLQHGIFNGLTLISAPAVHILPPSLADWLSQPFPVGALPLQRMDVVFLVIYGVILTVLVVMTTRLRGARGMPERPAPPTPQWPAGYPYAPYPYIPWGYGLAPQAGAVAPATAPAMTGGAR